ncbi:DUF4190 domain-containing protein [Actinomadura chokoriensis]|uniref:DUF4190 domain-containing protein n=1 Tax=Actinomadura chokoriensis TaxID=454156 RepID=UPI0031F84A3A
MTTPPPSDDAPGWAPPDAPQADVPPPGAADPAAPAPPPYSGPPAPPPFTAGAPYGPVRRPTNQFAVFAVVTGLVGLIPLAIGFAVTALVQAGRRGEKGRGLAVGGLAASVVWVLAGVVALAVTSALPPDEDRAGAHRGGVAPITGLDVGDCFTGFTDDGSGGYQAKELPCTQPHKGEVVARAEAPASVQLSRDSMTRWAENLCQDKTEYLMRSRYRNELEPYYDWSGDEPFDDDGLTLTCVVRYSGSAPLTTPLVATVDTKLKTYNQLTTGECIDEWEETDPFTATVSCTKPHRYQVYATFTLETSDGSMDFGGYPGEEALDEKAARGCDKRADKVFRNASIERDLEILYVMPSEADWMLSIHDIVCMVQAANGKLKKSVLP